MRNVPGVSIQLCWRATDLWYRGGKKEGKRKFTESLQISAAIFASSSFLGVEPEGSAMCEGHLPQRVLPRLHDVVEALGEVVVDAGRLPGGDAIRTAVPVEGTARNQPKMGSPDCDLPSCLQTPSHTHKD